MEPMETIEPEEKIESINIEQDNKKYILILKIIGDQLTLVLSEPEMQNFSYTKKITFQEIKELDKDLDDLESCEGFYTYLKSLAEKKAINIIEKEQNVCIKFTIKHIIKNNTIELILSSEAINTDELFKDLYKKIKDLESKDNIINELKNDNA